MADVPFASKLRSLRRERGWSQDALSNRLGISVDAIKYWEGGHGLPNLQNRQILMSEFGLSSAELGLDETAEKSLPVSDEVPQPLQELVQQNSNGKYSDSVSGDQQKENSTSSAIEQTEPARRPPVLPDPVHQANEQQHHADRMRMVRILRLHYETLLQRSLQETAWIDMELVERNDAVITMVDMLLPSVNQQSKVPVSAGTILEVYDAAVENLLILGEPGAGKSTLLIGLAQQLIVRAQAESTQPIPIIIPLSTWAEERQNLAVWLIEQLNQIYNVPTHLGEYWLKAYQLLPLLDGLDEMDHEMLPACINAINVYNREYQQGIVVCCRTKTYEDVMERQRLRLNKAVVVQPLLPEQIDAILVRGGEQLAALRHIMQNDTEWQGLATKPLFLNLIQLAYRGVELEQVPTRAGELQERVLHDYVTRMVNQKGDSKRYPLERLCAWLGWLALRMREHNQTIFYLEHLQPTWLEEKRFRPLYHKFAGYGMSCAIGLLMSLSLNAFFFGGEAPANNVLFALTGGLIGWLIYSEKREGYSLATLKETWKYRWKSLVYGGTRNGLIVGGITGLCFALRPPEHSHGGLVAGGSIFASCFLLTLLIQGGKYEEGSKEIKRLGGKAARFLPALRREYIEIGLVTALLLCAGIGISEGVGMGISEGVGMGISASLSYMVIGTFLSHMLLDRDSSITLNEIMRLSVNKLVQRNHLLYTFYVFLLTSLLYGAGATFDHDLKTGVIYGFSGALSISILYWAFIGLWMGVSQETFVDQERKQLNQGIRYSFRNALAVALLASLVSILIGSICDLLNYELRSILASGFSIGLVEGFQAGKRAIIRDGIYFEIFGALLPFLLTGGNAWLQHYFLRWLLYCARVAPLRYKRFLDDATLRIFLVQAGGGYRFLHRMVLDYFAQRET